MVASHSIHPPQSYRAPFNHCAPLHSYMHWLVDHTLIAGTVASCDMMKCLIFHSFIFVDLLFAQQAHGVIDFGFYNFTDNFLSNFLNAIGVSTMIGRATAANRAAVAAGATMRPLATTLGATLVTAFSIESAMTRILAIGTTILAVLSGLAPCNCRITIFMRQSMRSVRRALMRWPRNCTLRWMTSRPRCTSHC